LVDKFKKKHSASTEKKEKSKILTTLNNINFTFNALSTFRPSRILPVTSIQAFEILYVKIIKNIKNSVVPDQTNFKLLARI